MNQEILSRVACGFCVLIGLAAVILRPKVAVSWWFFVGMVLLGAERLLEESAAEAGSAELAVQWLTRTMWAQSLLPFFWLGFSLTYGRGNAMDRGEAARQSRLALRRMKPPMDADERGRSEVLLPFSPRLLTIF